MSLNTIRIWICLSTLLFLLSILLLIHVYTDDGPGEITLTILGWICLIATSLNLWNFRSALRKKRAEERRSGNQ